MAANLRSATMSIGKVAIGLALTVAAAQAVLGCTDERPETTRVTVRAEPTTEFLVSNENGGVSASGNGFAVTVSSDANIEFRGNDESREARFELGTVGAQPNHRRFPDSRSVAFARGAFEELIEVSAIGARQSWAFAETPGGAIRLRVAVRGAKFERVDDRGILFSGEGFGFRYSHALWIDGDGNESAVPVQWTADRIAIDVSQELVSRSRCPCTLDPTITPWFTSAPELGVSASGSVFPRVALNGDVAAVAWRRPAERTFHLARTQLDGGVLDPLPAYLGYGFADDPSIGVAWAAHWWAVLHRNAGPTVSFVGESGEIGRTVRLPTQDSSLNNAVIAANAAGWAVVVYSEIRPTGNSDIRMVRLTPHGQVLDASPVMLSDGTPKFRARPTVAASSGTFVIAWEERDASNVGDVVGVSLDSSGSVLTQQPVVLAGGTGSQEAPFVIAGSTNFLLSWVDKDFIAAPTVAVKVLDPTGTPTSTTSALGGPISTDTLPVGAFDGTNFVVGWSSSSAQTDEIYAARVSPSAVALDVPAALVVSGGRGPWFASASSASLAMAFESTSSNVSRALMTVISTASAPATVGSPWSIESEPEVDRGGSVACGATLCATAWTSDWSVSGHSRHRVVIQAKDGGEVVGLEWDAGVYVDGGMTYASPALAAMSDGFCIVWQQDSSLRGSFFGVDGGSMSVDFEVVAGVTERLERLRPSAISNQCFVAWQSDFGRTVHVTPVDSDGGANPDASVVATNGRFRGLPPSLAGTQAGGLLVFDAVGGPRTLVLTDAGVPGGGDGGEFLRFVPVPTAAAVAGVSGAFVVVWFEGISAYGARLDAFGQFVDLPRKLAEFPNAAGELSASFDGTHVIIAAAGRRVQVRRVTASLDVVDSVPIDIYLGQGRSISALSTSTLAPGRTLLAFDDGRLRSFVFNNDTAAPNGTPCARDADCLSGFCADDVCCDSPCDGGTSDCRACSRAFGAQTDGVCGAIAATFACHPSTGGCDPAEYCDGTGAPCPADVLRDAGFICRASFEPACDPSEVCDGVSTACPPNVQATPGTACQDWNVCTSGDYCSGGFCQTGNLVKTCAPSECRVEACAFATGTCEAVSQLADGSACNGGLCLSGFCVASPDAGVASEDAGVYIDGGADAGAGQGDAGTIDAGAATDAGASSSDAGVTPDGGVEIADGGTASDAGDNLSEDSGTGDLPITGDALADTYPVSPSCGCSGADSLPTWWLAISIALRAILSRRARRAQR